MVNLQQMAYEVARRYVSDCKSQGIIDNDTAEKVTGWIRSRSVGYLATADNTCEDAYSDLHYNRVLRQIAAFFKKNPAFASSETLDKATQASFEEAELLCGFTNLRLDPNNHETFGTLSPELKHAIRSIRSDISRTLGDYDNFIGELPDLVRVTAGATATRPRRKSSPHQKMSLRNVPCSLSAQPYLMAVYRFFGYNDFTFKNVYENRVVTVPKNFKTNRTIACEPEGNLSLQLALNGYIAKRLRKIRVDLSSQSLNQDLAKRASISGDYSTIDLSMASDTLAFNTVALLLPYEWFRFAADVRCPIGIGFGKTYRYEKFSSMGNGSTFTLETLIFASIVRYCVSSDEDYAVYGDDLIVPTKRVDALIALLKFFGFQVNRDKSYTQGPFRESCGTDWFEGTNVTPFYLRASSSMKIEMIHVINGLAAISLPNGELWQYLRKLVISEDLPLVPFNESSISGIWIDTHTAYRQRIITRKGHVPRFKAFVPRSKNMSVANSQTLALWFLNARTRRYESLKHSSVERHNNNPIITSSVPLFTHKYVRKWVGWFPPSTVTPAHIYMWTDFISRVTPEVKVRA